MAKKVYQTSIWKIGVSLGQYHILTVAYNDTRPEAGWGFQENETAVGWCPPICLQKEFFSSTLRKS